jgi:hypothetical protein
MMKIDFENALIERFKGVTEVPANEIVRFLRTRHPNLAEKTLQWRIHELKKKGIVHHVSRGIYSFTEKRIFIPSVSSDLKRLYNKINKELPYAAICVWDTRWLNEFMELQMFKHFLIIEAERQAAEAVHNRLVSPRVSVFLDPDKELYEKYIANHDEVIIVKTMISEAPTLEVNGIVCASLEKLLVDCLADTLLFSAQQNELSNIYQTAFARYKINTNAMRRYATRRNKKSYLEEQLKTLAKNGKSARNLK